ncbi:MAG: hypothetical protein AAGF46_09775 [Pseudomonadota bacterium]
MRLRLLFATIIVILLTIPFWVGGRFGDEELQLSYRPAHLIAHSIARVKRNQCDLAHIKITGARVFGLDSINALVTANFDAIQRDAPNIPQVYGLVLRTADGGRTWTQVFDPADHRISRITDVRFIGRRGLLLHEHSGGGQYFGFFYTQDFGETWGVKVGKKLKANTVSKRTVLGSRSCLLSWPCRLESRG